jgi:hypothetical protein
MQKEDQGRLVQKYLLQQKHKVAALEAKGLLCSNSQTCTLSQNGYGTGSVYHSSTYDDIRNTTSWILTASISGLPCLPSWRGWRRACLV